MPYLEMQVSLAHGSRRRRSLTHFTSSKNFSSFSAVGTSANLNSTESLTRGMSASTTSGLYLRRIISSVIVSEKFANWERIVKLLIA
jgi:hypothetical protein